MRPHLHLAIALASGLTAIACAAWWLCHPEDAPPERFGAHEQLVATTGLGQAHGTPAVPLVETMPLQESVALRESPAEDSQPLRLCGAEMEFEIVGRRMVEAGARVSQEVAWETLPPTMALHRLREGRCDIALLDERPRVRKPGFEVDDFESAIVDECVLALVVSPDAVHSLTTADARRLLNGRYDSWRRVGGSDLAVEWFGLGSRPRESLDVLFGLKGLVRSAATDHRDDAAILAAIRAGSGALGVVDLAALTPRELGPGSGRMTVAIDNILPTRDEYHAGRYPFGVSIRAVWRRGTRADTWMRRTSLQ